MGTLVTNETIVNRETIGENFKINGYRRNRAKGVRLDFTHFDRENPLGWALKVVQYFEFCQTTTAHRLFMASYHWMGKPLYGIKILLRVNNLLILKHPIGSSK